MHILCLCGYICLLHIFFHWLCLCVCVAQRCRADRLWTSGSNREDSLSPCPQLWLLPPALCSSLVWVRFGFLLQPYTLATLHSILSYYVSLCLNMLQHFCHCHYGMSHYIALCCLQNVLLRCHITMLHALPDIVTFIALCCIILHCYVVLYYQSLVALHCIVSS